MTTDPYALPGRADLPPGMIPDDIEPEGRIEGGPADVEDEPPDYLEDDA